MCSTDQCLGNEARDEYKFVSFEAVLFIMRFFSCWCMLSSSGKFCINYYQRSVKAVALWINLRESKTCWVSRKTCARLFWVIDPFLPFLFHSKRNVSFIYSACLYQRYFTRFYDVSLVLINLNWCNDVTTSCYYSFTPEPSQIDNQNQLHITHEEVFIPKIHAKLRKHWALPFPNWSSYAHPLIWVFASLYYADHETLFRWFE